MNRPESSLPDQGPVSEIAVRAKTVTPANDSVQKAAVPSRTVGPESSKVERQIESPFQEGELTDREVTRYLSEVFGGATNLSIRVKDSARSSLRPLERLPALHRLLLEKHVWGAQIRYSLRAAEWTDTLIVTHSGARVVRVRH